MDSIGEIITFYSYKGGTGRTMALANTASYLARQDNKVLMIDWDLEAPGLHVYFQNQIKKSIEKQDNSSGLLELFGQIQSLLEDNPEWDRRKFSAQLWEHIYFEKEYILKTPIDSRKGSLSLLKAGKFNDDYASQVINFDWQALFSRAPWLFYEFALFLKSKYDYILIDSRTGVSDVSGICTSLLPEKLVAVFTPNLQSIQGIERVIRDAISYRDKSFDSRRLIIFPLASRLDPDLDTKRTEWRTGNKQIQGYQPLFENLLKEVYKLASCSLDLYFEDILIQYTKEYSFGEQIAVLTDGDRISLGESYIIFINRLISSQNPWITTPEEVEEKTPSREFRAPHTYKYDVYLSYNNQDRESAELLAEMLRNVGINVFIDVDELIPGDKISLSLNQAIDDSFSIAILIGSYPLSNWQVNELDIALANKERDDAFRVIPMLLPGDYEPKLPDFLIQYTWVDFRKSSFEDLNTNDFIQLLAGIWDITPREARERIATTTSSAIDNINIANQLITSPPADYLYAAVPPLPKHFVGREKIIAQVVETLLSRKTHAISSHGPGGVGKTMLAIIIAHHKQIIDDFDGMLWAGCGTEPNLMEILANWGNALGIDLTEYADINSRNKIIKQVLGKKRILIILDDIWVEEHAQTLRINGPNIIHMLTTRDTRIARKFSGHEVQLDIESLDPTNAYKLLQQIAPEICSSYPEETRALAGEVGGLPLAIEILGAYLEASDAQYFDDLAEEAIEELRDPATRLAQATRTLGDTRHKEMSLAETISLSLSGLGEKVIKAFYALGAFAPKPASFTRAAAETIANCDVKTLAALLRRNLLSQSEKDSELLEMHKTLHDLAASKMSAVVQDWHAKYYLELAIADPEDWRTIEFAYPQIQWAWERLSEDKILDYISALFIYQKRRGLIGEQLKWLKLGLAKSENETDKDFILNSLGLVYLNQGQYDKALEYTQQALPINREVGNRAGEANSLNNVASIYIILGVYDKALEYLQQALPISREIGDAVGEAKLLSNLGLVYFNLGRYDQALEAAQQAIPIDKELGNRSGEATSLDNIGNIYNALGKYEVAEKNFLHALEIFRKIGDRPGEAKLLNSLGQVYSNLDKFEEAMEYFQQALQFNREVENRVGEARILNNLGTIVQVIGDVEAAMEHYQEALLIRQQLFGDKHPDVAVTLNNLGMLFWQQGDQKSACIHLRQALDIFESTFPSGHPQSVNVKEVLVEIGCIGK